MDDSIQSLRKYENQLGTIVIFINNSAKWVFTFIYLPTPAILIIFFTLFCLLYFPPLSLFSLYYFSLFWSLSSPFESEYDSTLSILLVPVLFGLSLDSLLESSGRQVPAPVICSASLMGLFGASRMIFLFWRTPILTHTTSVWGALVAHTAMSKKPKISGFEFWFPFGTIFFPSFFSWLNLRI